jgi:bacillithiol system protein YtxJ
MQATPLIELTNIKELAEVLAQTGDKAELIFKHSSTCPISMAAYEELEKYLAHPSLKVDYYLVVVQTARDVSNKIATQLAVEHESPQAILLHNGKVVWHASHRAITAATLAQVITTYVN